MLVNLFLLNKFDVGNVSFLNSQLLNNTFKCNNSNQNQCIIARLIEK